MLARDVSRETQADLDIYADLLRKWQRSINLVGPDTLSNLWERHFVDSLQLIDAMPQARHIVDLGSGAGFPGLVIAIALKQVANARVLLVESNGKKAAFLRAVVQATGAPAQILCDRLERVLPGLDTPDVVTARALAPLTQLLEWTAPLLKSGATGLFPKGRGLDQELMDAARYWEIDYEVIPSLVDRQSSILKIRTVLAKDPSIKGARP